MKGFKMIFKKAKFKRGERVRAYFSRDVIPEGVIIRKLLFRKVYIVNFKPLIFFLHESELIKINE